MENMAIKKYCMLTSFMSLKWWNNMKAEVDIKPFLKANREFRIAEQQPCGFQVVGGIGLVSANELVEKLKTLIYKILPLFWPDSLIIMVQD